MASDYEAIKRANIQKYGTDISRFGKALLTDRYDDRTHFVFELLQNAEDALKRRAARQGRRSVEFALGTDSLRVSHYGLPFTELDVRGICGIGEGTKSGDVTAIGHFGIGFKAVYAITESPEIHSGDEHFAIDSYVWPRAVPTIPSERGETVFVLPFPAGENSARAGIAMRLPELGVRTLLFLREIEEIIWCVDGGASGRTRRSTAEPAGGHGRRAVLSGQTLGQEEVVEEWLVFSRRLETPGGDVAGYVEVAFSLKESAANPLRSVARVLDSPLVVFFPTVVQSNLGFLVQGPYCTTPSRDNVPRHDVWNQRLVRETGELLVSALLGLRDVGLLDAEALRVLPIDRGKFGEDKLLSPLFEKVRDSLRATPLLPCYGKGHVSAEACAARAWPRTTGPAEARSAR